MKSFKFERVAPSENFLASPLWRYCVESAFNPNQEIGVELELEGFGADMMGGMTANKKMTWIAHNDPSLRGDSIELVLRRPVTYDEFINRSVPEFTTLKKEAGFKPNLSNRCSVHVHLDFAHKSVYSLCKFLTLYSLYEDFFFRACGPERIGNHFCISLRENARFTQMFVKALENQSFKVFSNENFRYMALNVNALWKFGSVEIRLHEGTADEERLKLWVTVLKELLDFATTNFKFTPDEIIRQSSINGLGGFTQEHLPTVWKLIKPVFYESYEHTDIAQDIAFGVSWEHAPKGAAQGLDAKKNQTGGKKGKMLIVDDPPLAPDGRGGAADQQHIEALFAALHPADRLQNPDVARAKAEWAHAVLKNPADARNMRAGKIRVRPAFGEDDPFA